MTKKETKKPAAAPETEKTETATTGTNPDRQGSRPWSELRLDVQEKLNELLAKDKHALVPEEVEFLKGRRAYLTSDQRRDLGIK